MKAKRSIQILAMMSITRRITGAPLWWYHDDSGFVLGSKYYKPDIGTQLKGVFD